MEIEEYILSKIEVSDVASEHVSLEDYSTRDTFPAKYTHGIPVRVPIVEEDKYGQQDELLQKSIANPIYILILWIFVRNHNDCTTVNETKFSLKACYLNQVAELGTFHMHSASNDTFSSAKQTNLNAKVSTERK